MPLNQEVPLSQASHQSELAQTCFTQATPVFSWKLIQNDLTEVDKL